MLDALLTCAPATQHRSIGPNGELAMVRRCVEALFTSVICPPVTYIRRGPIFGHCAYKQVLYLSSGSLAAQVTSEQLAVSGLIAGGGFFIGYYPSHYIAQQGGGIAGARHLTVHV